MSFGTDGEGWYYFGVRLYDPEIGVWLGTDPAEQFWNSYSYTGVNPVNAVDPDGRKVEFKDDRSALDWAIAHGSAFIYDDNKI